MSALDQAVADLEAKRAQDDAQRRERRQAARAFLKEFYEADISSSQKLKAHGVHAIFDGGRILLEKPEEGVYADGMMIVAGEQGEIDVSGRSLGLVAPDGQDAKKKE
ncbi:MAG TPA: hypothetical protein VGD13_05490, partial [Xanthobacteraceae bacterium]